MIREMIVRRIMCFNIVIFYVLYMSSEIFIRNYITQALDYDSNNAQAMNHRHSM